MLDTVRCQWRGLNFGSDFWDWLRAEYRQVAFHTDFYKRGGCTVLSEIPWQGATVVDEILGTVSAKSNMQGNFLTVERSLPKWAYGDNCRVLSIGETMTALSQWLAACEARFTPWFFPGVDPSKSRKIGRADICYQQQVPCSSEVFAQVASTLNTRRVVKHQYVLSPVQVHLGGVVMKQSARELARWYDKGLESGNESYHDVVRHEEQLRRGMAGYIVDVTGDAPVLNVAAAREQMNKRYQGWGTVDAFDLGTLLRDHGAIGGAALGLVIRPDLETTYRRNYSVSMFTRANKLAREARRHMTTVDLRLPEDAWREPMVL